MELQRRTVDDLSFALAFGAISAAGLGFASAHNGAAALMCLICLGGICGGRIVGVRGRTLLPVAFGLVAILWIAWVDPPGGPRTTSAFAHFGGGLLVGWALVATLRPRIAWPGWVPVALAALAAITIGWELAEYFGDRVFDTVLAASKRDSAADVFFGCLGGAGAIAIAALSRARRE